MTDKELREAAWKELEQTTLGYARLKIRPPTDQNSYWFKAKALLDQIVGAQDLRDSAWKELVLTTVGYARLKVKPPTDQNSHWYKAKALLDQIGGSVPPPPAAKPTNTALPAISGTAKEGQSLTASRGTWSGSPTSYTYKWQRCDTGGHNCVVVAGATGASYMLAAADVGKTLQVVVTATNAAGGTAAVSASSAVVVAAAQPPPPSGAVYPSTSRYPSEVLR